MEGEKVMAYLPFYEAHCDNVQQNSISVRNWWKFLARGMEYLI